MKITEVAEDLNDLTGCQFGDLTVIRRDPDHHLCHCRRWRCECSCGLPATAYETALLDGATVSCGCQNQAKPRRVKLAYAA
jgi:hypothetical protein